MSASPIARQISDSKIIPRRILISDPSEIPCSYSSTPGGTLFSTTPGGTKIVYERAFLMNLRNSPISKTPPSWEIPDQLLKGASPTSAGKMGKRPNNRYQNHNHHNHNHVKHNGTVDDNEQFQMEM